MSVARSRLIQRFGRDWMIYALFHCGVEYLISQNSGFWDSLYIRSISYYSANIKGDIKQLNSLWDGESKDLMAWRRIPSSAYRPGSRASRLSMPE